MTQKLRKFETHGVRHVDEDFDLRARELVLLVFGARAGAGVPVITVLQKPVSRTLTV